MYLKFKIYKGPWILTMKGNGIIMKFKVEEPNYTLMGVFLLENGNLIEQTEKEYFLKD